MEDNKNYGTLAKAGLPRYMTERFRYRTYNLIFVFCALAEYFLLAILLPIIPGIDALFTLRGAPRSWVVLPWHLPLPCC